MRVTKAKPAREFVVRPREGPDLFPACPKERLAGSRGLLHAEDVERRTSAYYSKFC